MHANRPRQLLPPFRFNQTPDEKMRQDRDIPTLFSNNLPGRVYVALLSHVSYFAIVLGLGSGCGGRGKHTMAKAFQASFSSTVACIGLGRYGSFSLTASTACATPLSSIVIGCTWSKSSTQSFVSVIWWKKSSVLLEDGPVYDSGFTPLPYNVSCLLLSPRLRADGEGGIVTGHGNGENYTRGC